MKNKLPNFLIVGAAKSGTTSLHNYLNQHPGIFMPSYNRQGMKVKEPRFLIKDLVQNRLHNGVWDWEEYKALFNDVKDESAIGESTVLYLYYYRSAIENIKRYLAKSVKIIIMLRNPTERAYSAFQHVSRGLKEKHSFEEALKLEGERMDKDSSLTPMVMYKEMGLYYEMVLAYKQNFRNVHIIFYDDFSKDTEEEVRKTFKFLGVSLSADIDFTSRHNVGGKRWKSQVIKNIFLRDYHLKSILKKIISESFRKIIAEIFITIFTDKVIDMKAKTRRELNIFFKDDIRKLSNFLNRDLTHWTR